MTATPIMLPSAMFAWTALALGWSELSFPIARRRTPTPVRVALAPALNSPSVAQANALEQGWGRLLGNMEQLLNARRSGSGTMTTAHVSVARVDGPIPSGSQMEAALAWSIARHPMLRACGRPHPFRGVEDARAMAAGV